ncbi:MAG TPA: hypothetical protein VF606_07905, partial [Geminicoccaceae bacterium]
MNPNAPVAPATPTWTEAERVAHLHDLAILDTAPEAAYDDLVRIAALVCATPIALVSLVDTDRQWFKAEVGLGCAETPRDQSVCAYAIETGDHLVIPDLTR